MSIFVLTSNIIKLLQFNELINDNMMLEINTYWGDEKISINTKKISKWWNQYFDQIMAFYEEISRNQ